MATQPFTWRGLHQQFDDDEDVPVAPKLTRYQKRMSRSVQPVVQPTVPKPTPKSFDFGPPADSDPPVGLETKPGQPMTRPRPALREPPVRVDSEQAPTTKPSRPVAPAPERYDNPLKLLGAAGMGPGNGFWRIIDQATAGLGGVKGPNADLVRNIAWGHTKKATNGGWIAQGLNQYVLYDAQGNEVERGPGLRGDLYDDAAQQAFHAQLVPGGVPGGGGGGAAGPTGAGAAGGGAPGQPGFESEIEQLIRSAASGDDGPFSGDVRQNLRAAAKEDAAGQLASTNKMAALTAQRSGNLYSGSTDETLAENARAAEGAVAQGNRAIDVQGAQANFDAKLKSRDQALSLLAQRREEAMANARNEIDRRRIANEYDIAIKNMQVQREQIQAQKDAADSAGRAELASARVNRDFQLELADRQNQYDIDRFTRERLPFLLAGYGE